MCNFAFSGRKSINSLTQKQQSITSEHQRLSNEFYAMEQKVSKASKGSNFVTPQMQAFTLRE